jgi:hypothetical protein
MTLQRRFVCTDKLVCTVKFASLLVFVTPVQLHIRPLTHPSGPLQQSPRNMTSDACLFPVTFLQFATRKHLKSYIIDISDC